MSFFVYTDNGAEKVVQVSDEAIAKFGVEGVCKKVVPDGCDYEYLPGSDIGNYDDLSDLKSKKKNELRESCKADITNIFTSSALGSSHNYDSRIEDQQNITARWQASNKDGQPRKIWCHNGTELSRVDHTKDELAQVIIDMEAHIESCQSKLESKINEVNSVTFSNRAELNSITW